MKNKNKIKIQERKKLYTMFILDRSGSMESVRLPTIESINGYIESLRNDAKKNEIDIFCTLLMFDSRGADSFHFSYVNSPLASIKNITTEDYVPSGGTPLRDAIGHGIRKIQETLGDSIGSDEVNILVTIFTDGQENSSTEYSHAQIAQMIKHLGSDKKWTFTFMGCGGIQEVQAYANTLNICNNNTRCYDGSVAGLKGSMKKIVYSTSNYVSSLSSGEDVTADFFSSAERKEEKKA